MVQDGAIVTMADQ